MAAVLRWLAVPGVLALAQAASAQPLWRIDPAASTITFAYEFAGEAREGRFTEMTGEGRFDAERPEATRFTLVIPVSGLDLGHRLISAFALSADWFDEVNHPDARYRLSRLDLAADGTATALGDLTIKGHLEVIEVPVTVTVGPEEARAQGSLRFPPRRFGIGVGPSALLVDIGDSVAVSFDIVARPVEGPGADTETGSPRR